ncbi:MAG TPA: tetratricopeptide repeat protein [Candidatus Binataceae bacterium]|nr:tetratricopeptide repeat protein [Candidatus Binataceae bacterium]
MASSADSTTAAQPRQHPASGAPVATFGADPRVWLVALLIVTAGVYSRSLADGFVFDERLNIIVNRYIGDWSFVWKSLFNDDWWFRDPLHLPQGSYYRPLTNVWLAINYHLFGLQPARWHAMMIAVHLVVACLVFRVSSLLSKNLWTALLAAALFALMPLDTEVVVVSFGPALSAAFQLSALGIYLRRADSPLFDTNQSRWLALSLALYAGALLSYEASVMFPLLVAAHAAIFRPPLVRKHEPASPTLGDRAREAFDAAWPYALAAAGYLALRVWVLGFITRQSPDQAATPLEVVLTIPAVIASYLMLLATPWLAGPAHALDFVQSAAEPEFYLSVIGLIILAACAFIALRNHPHRRLYLFCAAWFFLTLAPMLNLGGLAVKTIVQDRYLYIPWIGLCFMIADMAVTFAAGSEVKSFIVWIVSGAILTSYAAVLNSVQGYWKDDATVYMRCIELAPKIAFCHSGLATVLKTRGNIAGALSELKTAVNLDPSDGKNLYELGRMHEEAGNRSDAVREMTDGLRLIANPPASGYARLAVAADAIGDSKAADDALAKAAKLPDGANPADLARARLSYRHGDNQAAEQKLREVLKRDPDNAEALSVLGTVLSAEHRYDDALAAVQRAAQLSPDKPMLHYLVALALYQMGRNSEARGECAIALAAEPDDYNARALMIMINSAGKQKTGSSR